MIDAASYFAAKLAYETDASDVYAAQRAGQDVVLLDVRSDAAWRQGRISGALHMPYREIPARAPRELAGVTEVIVYCWGPGCNAGTKAAASLAGLGIAVREMIGGYEYWVREGQPTENDQGPLPRTFDPQAMVVRSLASEAH
ncbi:rhodanese-like domain-containing protein [Microbacterium sp. ET2]|uniref:rhodanese-like domain-containing protein n=1 Tax=Microbacterium albipurpureum TaxID=3050384 RepID=UPI00259CB00A|nr:rhodanese-like domain-containing protein [Microbacterium sp. ET2 (Ac-2212)]WJL95411.1 rhodanese-like domain-containing protein [Microbacterium sp. ET2 (Ac-2212)]